MIRVFDEENFPISRVETPAVFEEMQQNNPQYKMDAGDLKAYNDRTPRIWDFYEGSETNFQNIDYVRGLKQRLFPCFDFNQGELQKITYYAEAHENKTTGEIEFSDPVVCERRIYFRDADNFALSRTMTISWFNLSGEEMPETKTREKLYDFRQRIEETERRRVNIISNLKSKIFFTLRRNGVSRSEAIPIGGLFFMQIGGELTLFRETGVSDQLLLAINSNTAQWLDWKRNGASGETIREYMVEELTL